MKSSFLPTAAAAAAAVRSSTPPHILHGSPAQRLGAEHDGRVVQTEREVYRYSEYISVTKRILTHLEAIIVAFFPLTLAILGGPAIFPLQLPEHGRQEGLPQLNIFSSALLHFKSN